MLHTEMDLANISQGSWSKKTSYCTFHLYETSITGKSRETGGQFAIAYG